jgi:type IV secretory pathway TrbL component
LADGILEMFGELFHLVQTNIMCMVGVLVFGIVVVLLFVIWYMRRIMNQEIFVHGGRWDKDKK